MITTHYAKLTLTPLALMNDIAHIIGKYYRKPIWEITWVEGCIENHRYIEASDKHEVMLILLEHKDYTWVKKCLGN